MERIDLSKNDIESTMIRGHRTQKNKLIVGALAFILTYMLVVYYGFDDSYVRIHDFMDSQVAAYKIFSNMSIYSYLRDESINNAFNGISAINVLPGINIGFILYMLLKPIVAIIVNEAIMRLAAFWGMLLLFENHIFPKDKSNYRVISVGVSLCFAMLRFHPPVFLSIAGQPFVLYAFLNLLKDKRTKYDWIIIIIFTMYSTLVFAGFPVCAMFSIILLFDGISNRKVNYTGLLALLLITLLYLIGNYKLIYTTFFDASFISHRAESRSFTTDPGLLFSSSLKVFIGDLFMSESGAAASYHSLVILPTVVLGIFFLIKNKEKSLLFKLVLSITMISLFFGFWGLIKFYLPKGSITQGFNWARIQWLNPLLWYLVFGLSLSIIRKNLKYANYLICFLIVIQLCYNISKCDPIREYKKSKLTFKKFHSESLFTDIKDYIGKPLDSYRVVSIGIYPSIALFNGFYTLDAYLILYSLEYKHRFRKIIRKELEKNEDLRKYFDYWGNRCYVFVDELAKYTLYRTVNINKNSGIKINNLELNTKVLKEMGGKYIFSSVEIVNCQENNLKFLRTFENKVSPWRIYLYEVG